MTAHRRVFPFLIFVLGSLFCSIDAQTQRGTASSVPRLIKYSGSVRDGQSNPRSGVVGVMFSIYPQQVGSAALWSETQNVSLDSQGRYTVLLGSEHSEGLSMDVFASSEGRWLGVQVMAPGEPEQPRVLLVSVPYALKAGDAETLGGLPASAFLMAQSALSIAPGSKTTNPSSRAQRELTSPTLGAPTGVMTTGGTAGQLSKFQDASTIVDSIITEFVNAGAPTNASRTHIGIGTATPSAKLSVVSDSAADPSATATVNISNTNGTSTGFGATLAVSSTGGSDPLILATKSFRGDSVQFGELLVFTGDIQFTQNNSKGAQGLAVIMDIPASNTFSVVGILGANYLTTNEGTGNVGVITGFESDAVSSAGTSAKVEGMEVSGTNDGGNIAELIGGATKIWSTQSLGATPGTTTDGMGLVVRSPQIDAGVINNVYGLRIENQVGGTNSNFAISTGLGPVSFGDKTLLAPSTANAASLNIPAGATPTAPLAGDIWNDGTNLLTRSAGLTKTLAFSSSVSTETTRATSAESTLTANLASESARAQAVEANLRIRGIAYIAGCDSCNLLLTNDSEKTIYMNVVGPMTINQVTCFSDAGSPNINLQRDDGSPANILSSDLTCSPSGATTTGIAGAESVVNLNDKIDFYVTNAGTSAHRVTLIIKATLN